MKEFILAFKKWNALEGRATRREYWMFYLICIGIGFLVGLIVGIMAAVFNLSEATVNLIINLQSLLFVVPSITVAVRRVHDAGKSGWFVLVPFYNIYLLVVPSQKGHNRFGPHPHPVAE